MKAHNGQARHKARCKMPYVLMEVRADMRWLMDLPSDNFTWGNIITEMD